MKSKNSFTYIDLFAGCGGLSLGLEAEGAELILAVEKSSMASETFFANFIQPANAVIDWKAHLSSELQIQIKNKLAVEDIQKVLPKVSSIPFVAEGGNVDLVAGGPPCQGFSLAGRRNSTDSRNTLPLDFLEFVKKVKPKFVIIENVVGMSHKFDKEDDLSPFESLAISLEKLGVSVGEHECTYLVQRVRANAAHFGAAQNRERMFLIAARSDIAKKLKLTATSTVWISGFKDQVTMVPDLAPKPTTESSNPQTVVDALSDFIVGKDSEYTKLLKDAAFWALPTRPDLGNTSLRSHSVETRTKFALMHLIKDHGLSPALLKQKRNKKELLEVGQSMAIINDLKYPISLGFDLPSISSGPALKMKFAKHKTAKHSQRVIRLDRPAPTIVTSADDYIHPVEPRAMSVRELARFQGFPDAFTFCSKETTGGLKRRTEVPQYSQVGNAVSPFMALSLGKLIATLMRKYES
jgi:DNA (cytosine-5)-methyltransferase 1